MNKLVLFLIAILVNLVHVSLAQNILITDPDFNQQTNPLNCTNYADGSVTNFFDAGDVLGAYGNNANDTLTICPDPTLGSKVTVAFGINAGFAWAVDSTDTLFVFDGPSVNSPLLGAFNSNTHPNGVNVQASFANNPTGCLTFQFISDAADTADGWLANITCGNPPQPFIAHLEGYKNGDTALALAPADTGYIDVCLGDSVLFIATPSFPYSLDSTGTGYVQNISNVTVNWEFSDGTSATGDSVWFKPSLYQGYLVTLKITDNFPSVEYLIAKVRVSTKPTFAGIIVENDSICIGDTTKIFGGVTATDTVGVSTTTSNFQMGGTFAGLTYLPDGSGVNYSTSVNITGFIPGDTVSAVTDIEQMCVTIEHTYLGDLEMWLECPNGTTVTIFNSNTSGFIPGGFGGGSTYLGDANDLSSAPGTGWEYCFSSVNSTFGTFATEFAAGNTLPTSTSFTSAMNPNGVYLPEQSFADFIGCPVNGTWTLFVRDNIAIDDGYIFEWGVFFDPAINPNNENYTPLIINDIWSSTSPNIIDSIGFDTLINIVGQTQGTDFFTYTVEDDFGCFSDTTVTVVVAPQPVLQMNILGNPTICPGDDVIITTQGSSAIPPYNYVWSTGASGTGVQLVVNPVTDSLFIVTLTDWCNSAKIDTAFITVPISLMSSTSVFDSVFCPGTLVNMDLGLAGGATPYVYTWNSGDTTATISDNPNTTTSYYLSVTDQCNKLLVDSAEVYVPAFNPISIASTTTGDVICKGDGQIMAVIVTDGATHVPLVYTWSNDTANTDTFALVNVIKDTLVVVTVTDGCGNSTFTTFSSILPTYSAVVINTTIDSYLICEKDTVEANVTVNGGTGNYVYTWNGSGYIATEVETTTLLSPTDQLGYDFIAVDECGLTDTLHINVTYEDCSVTAPLIFTPNGDAYNQYLEFTNLEKWPYNHLMIFDRWGKKIYDDNYNNDWSGGGHRDGVYYYVLTLNAEQAPITGYFHIKR